MDGEKPSTAETGRPDAASDGAALAAFVLHRAPGHLLRRCQQIAVDAFVQEVGPDGLRPRQFALLHTIQCNEGLSQTELVRQSGIDRSTVADMVRRLIDKGLLTRRRTEADGRANALRLTAGGRAALDAALPGVARAQARILAPLPLARRKQFIEDLRVLADLEAD